MVRHGRSCLPRINKNIPPSSRAITSDPYSPYDQCPDYLQQRKENGKSTPGERKQKQEQIGKMSLCGGKSIITGGRWRKSKCCVLWCEEVEQWPRAKFLRFWVR
ncbi:hypothetical protein CDAR_575021 [Caerostris darwini]|uniref:Uncharacterized protein n=1 Tax=Caerostris darwini TaxID=1538125 RepID=A0AAV4SY77_9ARAC|nr:hypothetical protein CDAR_575021 [Caerostris darwini]